MVEEPLCPLSLNALLSLAVNFLFNMVSGQFSFVDSSKFQCIFAGTIGGFSLLSRPDPVQPPNHVFFLLIIISVKFL